MQRRFAIILGGGRSARMGRDKRALTLDGRSLLALAVDACATRDGIVAVTPDLPDDVAADQVIRTLEDPPFGGPVAGIAAGVAALPPAQTDDEVLLLACDLPHVGEILAVLDAAPVVGCGLDHRRALDCVCLVDAEGYPQYLAARYRRAALENRLAAFDTTRSLSVRRLMSGLAVHRIAAPDIAADVDTPEQAEAAGLR
ncbi:MAG: NTP transferase domain-containing protein [Micropruina sp.]|uniref:molybdenum cofactor guanylyltransferase n=1 Tax=Micropruina sp. TaxID=2737536 RepID=UPI0039E4C095